VPHRISIDSDQAKIMLTRLELAMVEHKLAMQHLTRAIEETEASRLALHSVGLQCWVDRLDDEKDH
jgi:Zn-finger domain-containing protein